MLARQLACLGCGREPTSPQSIYVDMGDTTRGPSIDGKKGTYTCAQFHLKCMKSCNDCILNDANYCTPCVTVTMVQCMTNLNLFPNLISIHFLSKQNCASLFQVCLRLNIAGKGCHSDHRLGENVCSVS